MITAVDLNTLTMYIGLVIFYFFPKLWTLNIVYVLQFVTDDYSVWIILSFYSYIVIIKTKQYDEIKTLLYYQILINVQLFTESLFKHIRSRCNSVNIGLKSISVISIRRLNRTRSLAIISHGEVLS